MPKGRIKPPHISSHIEGRYVTLLVAPDLEWHLVLSHFYNSTSVAFSRSGFVWPQPWNSKWAGGPLLPRVSVARFVVSTDTEKMGVPRFSRFSRSGLSDSWHRKGLVLCGWRSNLHLEDLAGGPLLPRVSVARFVVNADTDKDGGAPLLAVFEKRVIG